MRAEQSRPVDIEEVIINPPTGKRGLSTDLHVACMYNLPSNKANQFRAKWIQFIDSGGQFQYHDILPLFIQNPGVTIFVNPTIEYYGADGRPVSIPYASSLSHDRSFSTVLEHCAHVMLSL